MGSSIQIVRDVGVAADEAADTFNKLFGDDLKRVAATPSPADDIALAKQLLEAAGKVTNQTAFLTLLCSGLAHEPADLAQSHRIAQATAPEDKYVTNIF